ncbi:MAG: hypothetical protein M1814_003611 [Vezdaea aestivalis]|nr:MAG: hypothetical protein M1814_003611 [Vezdaea aestivalis]
MAFENLLSLRGRRSDTNLRHPSRQNPSPSPNGTKERPKTSDARSSTVSGRSSTSALDDANGTHSATPNEASSPQHDPLPRFDLRKFRNASDPQLSKSAKLLANQDDAPPIPTMPPPPSIITTAPTSETMAIEQPAKKQAKQKQRFRLSSRTKSSISPASPQLDTPRPSSPSKNRKAETVPAGSGTSRSGRVTFDESNRPSLNSHGAPPPYEEAGSASLALPVSRLSESSRSDASSGDHIYASQTTTHVSTTTTFFRLPRRTRKETPSLFPLPVKIPPSESVLHARGRLSSDSPTRSARSPGTSGSPRRSQQGRPPGSLEHLPISEHAAVAGSPVARNNSTQSIRSDQSSPTLQPPARFGQRGRSSTMSSLSTKDDHGLPTPTTQSGRTSTSTVGRASLAGFFNRSLFRQGSENPFNRNGSPVTGGPQTPGSCTSKSNSFQLPRDTIVVPERDGDEPPSKYLARLQEAVSRGTVASVLSKSTDPFHKSCLRSYMRRFSFFEIPMDMAIRKLLMEVELPKETQQIDRVIEAFADRYHECNPGIYASTEKAYFIAFSLLILHTDVFNKNNKHKMQKPDYIKVSSGQGIVDGILECFYDNISYTPFIHVEDEVDLGGERFNPHKSRKISFPKGSTDPAKRVPKSPVDPYTLIIDDKLDILRPSLQDVMILEDPYNYLASGQNLDMQELGETFFKTGVLQIVSARSRPDAFMSPSTITNPEEASAGVVDIKVTKVGILWRKDPKKKKARSPWQEWGAVLTGTQLYFFKNTTWTKTLLNQFDNHIKQGNAGIPVIFKPPLEAFKPDALMSTDDAVALTDSSYRKHKNAFMFVRHGGFEETFLAESSKDMSDWLAKLNYASAFRTAGVRMRGVVAGNYEGQRTRAIRRMDGGTSARIIQTTAGEVSIQSGKIDSQLAQQILTARRQIIDQRIDEAGQKLEASQKQLDMLLRNARHFRLLAPVQPRSREQLILAAGRMAAQLKWVRMEMWRLKCHRDILCLDLQEDDRLGISTTAGSQGLSPSVSGSDRALMSRIDSSRSAVTSQNNPPNGPQRPLDANAKSREYGMDEIFQSPPEVARQSSQIKGHPSWALPPLSFDAIPDLSDTEASQTRLDQETKAAALARQHSVSSLRATSSLQQTGSESARPSTPPNVDDGELSLLKEAGLVSEPGSPPEPSKRRERRTKETPATAQPSKEKAKHSTPESGPSSDRSKVRRSLHRTLRETTHAPSHHRSKKGKDSASSAGLADDGSSIDGEGLARGTGSFTVHGKKASVVTFGSEWQAMSTEERMRLRKQATTDEARLLGPIAVEDESDSAVIVDRRGSDVSQSTATNASLRETRLHERPAQRANKLPVEDSEAELSQAESMRLGGKDQVGRAESLLSSDGESLDPREESRGER